MQYPFECFLIDDDIDDQEIFGMALRDLDKSIHCIFANDGIQALEKLSTETSFVPDYIFIDFNMPRMNGIEFLKRVRQLYPGTVRVMLSGASDMHSLIATINEGAIYKFLEKPVSARPFRQALRDAFLTKTQYEHMELSPTI